MSHVSELEIRDLWLMAGNLVKGHSNIELYSMLIHLLDIIRTKREDVEKRGFGRFKNFGGAGADLGPLARSV